MTNYLKKISSVYQQDQKWFVATKDIIIILLQFDEAINPDSQIMFLTPYLL